jgi:hypothetical protein
MKREKSTTRHGRPAPRALAAALALAVSHEAFGQAAGSAPAPGPEAQGLAKQLSNPVASLVSVPFQLNFDQGVGPDDDQRFVTNFQPVMPFSLGPSWNVVARVIVPVLSQPSLAPAVPSRSGLGDITASFFFSPARTRVFWGAGPALLLPVSADPFLGTEQWAAGPTFVVLRQAGPWTYGMLANHLWSYAGDSSRPGVDQTFLQPFVAYATRSGFTFTLNTESTANWKAAAGERWTVPIHLQVSKVTRLGRRPVSVGLAAGYYVESPEAGPSWRIRTTFTLIFPR